MRFFKHSLLLSLLFAKSLFAVDMESIPHVNKKASDSFKYNYLYANSHRAYAIAPGGAWSWVAKKPNETEAREAALETCARHTQQKCVLFALNNQIIFNYNKWYTLWGPYKTKQQALTSEKGVLVGQQFPDLVYTDPEGKKNSIHKLKGKVTFVHFWASWCPSCAYEFPAIMDMYRVVNDILPGQMEFVIVQVRESIEDSKYWALNNSAEKLPLSDSGVKNDEDEWLSLTGGEKIEDRQLAKIFPASYVLDKNGVVVFSNMGSIDNWTEYVNFIKHTVENSSNDK